MEFSTVEHPASVWMVDDVPVRMFYDGRRWRVTDRPTRLSESVWTAPLEPPRSLYGWRFQATDDSGASAVFDVFRQEHGWMVFRSWV